MQQQLQIGNLSDGYFCINLRVIYICSAVGSTHFLSVSLVRENLRESRENKTQNPISSQEFQTHT